MKLPNVASSQTVFKTKAEELNASLPLNVKGKTSFRNRVAMRLSNPVSRHLFTSTRQKVEAKLQDNLYTIEDEYRVNILEILKKKSNLMGYIYNLRQENILGQDVTKYITKANLKIKKYAIKTIDKWEDNGGQFAENGRDGLRELLSDPAIYLGELIDISRNERPIVRTYVKVKVDKGFIEVEKNGDFDKLGIKTKIVGDERSGKYQTELSANLVSLVKRAWKHNIEVRRDGEKLLRPKNLYLFDFEQL
ncbi:MAG: hypothetical protein ABJ360_11985 [Roseobacter sp.]|uniref:hypothetical protein n=1 Tax=Alphaproteobacteria TaxID=28211 RepID=UPI00326795EB